MPESREAGPIDRFVPSDYDKERRKEWLRNEIYRLRTEIDNRTYRRDGIDRRVTELRSNIYNLRYEVSNIDYQLSTLQDQLNTLNTDKIRAKRNRRDARTPDEKAYWNSEVYRLDGEIAQVEDRMYNLNWRRNELTNAIQWKSSEVESLSYERNQLSNEIRYRQDEMQAHIEELRQLER